MFLRNAWYVAAWDTEVTNAPLARTLLGEPVVLFRTQNGRTAALEDRCCHRHVPLSLGSVIEDELQCGYHGLRFDATGACVAVPGQTKVPPGAKVRSFPVVERHGWIWIWMGDPARADATVIPDWWWMDHPDWQVVRGNEGRPLHIKCHYELITDNLLDLSHLSFVHADTIGADSILDYPVKTAREADGIKMTRLIPNEAPAPLYKMAGDFAGNVDRWQIVDALVPGCCDVDVGSAEVGSGVLEGDRPQGIAFHALSAATPETATSTHQFYAHPRMFALDSEEMDEVYRVDFRRVFMEDVAMMEAQQIMLDRNPDRRQVDINVDAPALAMRTLIAERIAAEHGSGHASP
jgi:phenylpropionate dioxygenase-like ring-hydroxylating dioxygenase large terminal subunit